MPLFDIDCSFCRHRFEARLSTTTPSVPCPLCLTSVGRSDPPQHATPLEIEARRLGAAHGLRVRDGDDLERYREEHGDDTADTLLADIWSERLPHYQQLALAAGDSWKQVCDDVYEQYAVGFLAGCRT